MQDETANPNRTVNTNKTLGRLKDNLNTLTDILVKSVCLVALSNVFIHLVQHPGDLSALKLALENLQAIKLIP